MIFFFSSVPLGIFETWTSLCLCSLPWHDEGGMKMARQKQKNKNLFPHFFSFSLLGRRYVFYVFRIRHFETAEQGLTIPVISRQSSTLMVLGGPRLRFYSFKRAHRSPTVLSSFLLTDTYGEISTVIYVRRTTVPVEPNYNYEGNLRCGMGCTVCRGMQIVHKSRACKRIFSKGI